MEAKDIVYDGKRANPFLHLDNSDFSNNYTMYTTGERSDKNNIWTPSPNNKISTQDPFSHES